MSIDLRGADDDVRFILHYTRQQHILLLLLLPETVKGTVKKKIVVANVSTNVISALICKIEEIVVVDRMRRHCLYIILHERFATFSDYYTLHGAISDIMCSIRREAILRGKIVER